MNEDIDTPINKEIEWTDIWQFLQRQQKFIFTVFLLSIATSLVFALTRPTIWQGHTSLMIGERLFFSEQQIESFEEIKYNYESNVVIRPIKKTRIIEITALEDSKEKASNQVGKTVDAIIFHHQTLLNEKKLEFVSLLNAINKHEASKTELISLLDNASNSSMTKQLSEVSVEEKKYSGLFIQSLLIGVFAGLFLSIALATLKDYLDRKTVT